MKYIMLLTYSNNEEYSAITCNSKDEAVKLIKQYIEAETESIKNTQHYAPRLYSEKDDNVTLFYTSQDINLDTDYMNCRIIIPGHKTDLAPNI